MTTIARLSLLLLTAALAAQGHQISFAEQYALATDRAKVLEQLIPGTEDHFFYHALHHLNAGDFDRARGVLSAWQQQFPHDSRLELLQVRAALLDERNPDQAFRLLQQRLQLHFDDQRRTGGATNLPTSLDPAAISAGRILQELLRGQTDHINGFTDQALDLLATADLSDAQVTNLLSRAQRPDLPNLTALILRDLQARRGNFGDHQIHRNLTLAQLEELAQQMPGLLTNGNFVGTFLQRLVPGSDEDAQRNVAVRKAWLERLWSFSRRLPPTYNWLRAQILHHQLSLDLSAGTVDQERFMTWLRLPRRSSFVREEYRQRAGRNDELATARATAETGFERPSDEDALLRSCLLQIFATADSHRAYAELVDDRLLRRLFAEAKIVAGVGDETQWYRLLDDPSYYEHLRNRVDVEIAPTQPRHYAADAKVAIDVDVKNVQTLLVKVFAIDTFGFLRTHLREVDASIALDGMVANEETTHRYEESPFRRVRRHFDFPSLTASGTYVVEFIGNGISSRALIKKGSLQYVERRGAAGHVLRVIDDGGRFTADAAVWFGGKDYRPDRNGEIVLPYGSEAGSKPLILRQGNIAVLDSLNHAAEQYTLDVGVLTAREALLSGRRAQFLLRPRLSMNGAPVSLKLLENIELSIRGTDLTGVPTTMTMRDLQLDAAAELVQEITVPENLVSVELSLSGRVKRMADGAHVALSGGRSFECSGIDTTTATRAALLSRTARGFHLELRGKNGEIKAGQPLHLRLRHRLFNEPVHATLQTDEQGRVQLGELPGITHLTCRDTTIEGGWLLRDGARTQPTALHALQGETLSMPSGGAEVERAALALFEMRAGRCYRDAFASLGRRDGQLELRELPPGDYQLVLKQHNTVIPVRIAAGGSVQQDWVVGGQRMLERRDERLLHVVELATAGERLRIRLGNSGPDTRVHVFAGRYLEAYDPFDSLALYDGLTPAWREVWRPETDYQSGREIGDEYRYILDRRFAPKYAGNMLARPGLLLNPWALDESATSAVGKGGSGGRYGARGGGRMSPGPGAPGGAAGGAATGGGRFANLDFLPQATRLMANLRPDNDGVVTVPLAELGQGSQIHVIAADSRTTVHRTLARAEQGLQPRTRELRNPLAPDAHVTQQRSIEFVDTGGSAVIEDVQAGSAETFDSLATVFRLFQTLSRNAQLDEFAFVLRWPQLSDAEKRAEYSKHACHELHFFLYHKDRAFFDAVLKPYLADKGDKTFLDHWLLGDDLRVWLEPWKFATLNVVERILLAQRIEGEAAHGARHVRELFELLPPAPAVDDDLFRTALVAGLLADTRSVVDEQRGVPQPTADPTAPAEAPATAAPADKPAAPGRRTAGRTEAEKKLKDAAEPELAKAEANEADRGAERARTGRDDFFLGTERAGKEAEDLERRNQVRQLYREPEVTRRYAEANYWRVPIERHDGSLITVNAFWNDYAAARRDQPFRSANFLRATASFAEMMLALAVLDLPFTAAEHKTTRDGNRSTLQAASPLLFVRQELRPAAAVQPESSVLVSQNYVRADSRYRYEGNEQVDNYVTGEFLIDVVYTCVVTLTNPTSSNRRFDLLLQVPAGSTPVNRGFHSRTLPIHLTPFATQSVEYSFYFAAPGDRTHYPAHVSRDGTVLAFTEPAPLHVVAVASNIDTNSWDHVSQHADDAALFAWLDRNNLQRVDLDQMAWRMRDRAFYDRALATMRQRHVWSHRLWSYAIHHKDVAATREYLRTVGTALGAPTIDCALLAVDPVERRAYQQLDFEPLFNARAHRFGRHREILNVGLAAQYEQLMHILIHRPQLRAHDWMAVTYYLLLQDRIDEALAAFGKVEADQVPMRVQYDYMRAYLAFYTEDRATARRIATAHKDHAVERWRLRFRDVLNHLDEAEGGDVAMGDPRNRTGTQDQLASTEPALDLTVEARRVTVTHQNLAACEVSYYPLDIEFSFSNNPFPGAGTADFPFVRPNRRDQVVLAGTQTAFELPAEFHNRNVLVEVQSAGLVKRQAYVANSMQVQFVESYGQLRATDAANGNPLPKTYVKVYAMEDGQVKFYKDGYTDLRGRFDYASLSDRSLSPQRFAVLVLSETAGAVVKELAPPAK